MLASAGARQHPLRNDTDLDKDRLDVLVQFLLLLLVGLRLLENDGIVCLVVLYLIENLIHFSL